MGLFKWFKPEDIQLESGSRFASYRLHELINSGGMAQLWLASNNKEVRKFRLVFPVEKNSCEVIALPSVLINAALEVRGNALEVSTIFSVAACLKHADSGIYGYLKEASVHDTKRLYRRSASSPLP